MYVFIVFCCVLQSSVDVEVLILYCNLQCKATGQWRIGVIGAGQVSPAVKARLSATHA